MSDPDTLYYHQAIKEPDHKNFKHTMVKEVKDWKSNDNYEVVPSSESQMEKQSSHQYVI